MNNAIVVEISNRQSRLPVDEQLMKRAVTLVIEESPYVSAEISIGVVDDQEMHQLNVSYLDHDYPTDVLSFPLTKTDEFLAGEILVSIDTAESQAKDHGLSTGRELTLYVIHGALHLVGFDDKQESDRQVMRQKEQWFMQKIEAEQGSLGIGAAGEDL